VFRLVLLSINFFPSVFYGGINFAPADKWIFIEAIFSFARNNQSLGRVTCKESLSLSTIFYTEVNKLTPIEEYT
jgi:hypothetical protein